MGDQASFKILYELTSPKLYGLLIKLMGDPDTAADVLQEAFTKVWLNADKCDVTLGHAWPWLCQVSRNTALDKLRQQKRLPISIEDIEWVENEHCLSDEWQNDIDLSYCLEKLSTEPRQAVIYAYLYGLTHTELAEKFQKPLGTLKSWIRRAMLELEICLKS